MSYTPPAGNSVELIFADAPTSGPPYELIFGSSVIGEAISVTVAGELEDIGGAVLVAPPILATISGALEDIGGEVAASYSNDVQRPLVASGSSSWQTAADVRAAVDMRMQEAQPLRVAKAAAWSPAQPLPGLAITVAMPARLLRSRTAARSGWQAAQPLQGRPAASAWQNADRSRRPVARSGWQVGQALQSDAVRSVFENALHDRRQSISSPWQPAHPMRVVLRTTGGDGLALEFATRADYENAMRPPPGRSTWGPVVPPFDPCYLPPAGDEVELVFSGGAATDNELIFVCERHDTPPPATVVIPVRRVYMVQNEVSLRRVDGDIAIACPSLQLSIDNGSWTWGFSASVPGSELAKLEPASFGEPVELEAVVNGTAFRVLAEGISRDRTFNRSALRVSGRGRSAVLDTPYALERAFSADVAMTAQQLANDALSISGVPSGWLVDWDPDDWLVPAGAWSHQGSPISALNRIAEAAGAYVQSHPSEDRLLILPHYPVGPWDWSTATPDFELPAAVVQREGIDWADRAVYNRVFVCGSTAGGVRADIKRAGTAGDLVAAMITDALCTDIVAGRQRAMPVLANVGRQATVSLRLPVLPETGVIVPGAFVRYVDGSVTRQGLVRSAAVDAGRPQVWQTIGVQTYG